MCGDLPSPSYEVGAVLVDSFLGKLLLGTPCIRQAIFRGGGGHREVHLFTPNDCDSIGSLSSRSARRGAGHVIYIIPSRPPATT